MVFTYCKIPVSSKQTSAKLETLMERSAHRNEAFRPLEEHSDLEIAYLLLRELYRAYDHGGHSGRSVRSQVLEAGLAVCQNAIDRAVVRGDNAEYSAIAEVVAKRANRPYQLGLYDELEFLTTEDFILLSMVRVHELHYRQDDPGMFEGRLIALLLQLLQSAYHVPLPYTYMEIIREGRSRVFYAVENERTR